MIDMPQAISESPGITGNAGFLILPAPDINDSIHMIFLNNFAFFSLTKTKDSEKIPTRSVSDTLSQVNSLG